MAEPSRKKWFSEKQPRVCHVCGQRVTLNDPRGAVFLEFPVFRSWHKTCQPSRLLSET